MQMFSNAGQDEAEKVEKDARPYVVGPVPRKLRYSLACNPLTC